MTLKVAGARPCVLALKRRLAETLARSRLDYTDDILILNAFLRDFREEQGATPEEVRRSWESLLRKGAPAAHAFSVYLHIPFCAKKCHFCYCATEVSTNEALIGRYVPELKEEIAYYAALFDGMPARLLQVGGGTPNILSAADLAELLRHVLESFRMEQDAMRVIEFNPAGSTPEKLGIVRGAGFNRISFGVQSLNASVLARENREYQTSEMTQDAVRWAKEAGFEVINVDLLLGLAGDTVDSFLDGFRKIAELRPTSIIVPGLTMTDAYMKVMGIGREENLRHYEGMLDGALEGMARLGRQYGYKTQGLTANHGIWVLYADDTPAAVLEKAIRSDHFRGGIFSVLGLGHHARSIIFGEAVYERYPRRFSPGIALYRRTPMSRKEEMMRYILYALENHSRVDDLKFRERFGLEIREEFALELEALRVLGKIRMDQEGFVFLPMRGPERIFYGLFFLMDVLSQSPFSRGSLDESFFRRLRQELKVSL